MDDVKVSFSCVQWTWTAVRDTGNRGNQKVHKSKCCWNSCLLPRFLVFMNTCTILNLIFPRARCTWTPRKYGSLVWPKILKVCQMFRRRKSREKKCSQIQTFRKLMLAFLFSCLLEHMDDIKVNFPLCMVHMDSKKIWLSCVTKDPLSLSDISSHRKSRNQKCSELRTLQNMLQTFLFSCVFEAHGWH